LFSNETLLLKSHNPRSSEDILGKVQGFLVVFDGVVSSTAHNIKNGRSMTSSGSRFFWDCELIKSLTRSCGSRDRFSDQFWRELVLGFSLGTSFRLEAGILRMLSGVRGCPRSIPAWRREFHQEISNEQRLLESIGGWPGAF